ncbi:GDSL-type esterase/lipase family protein [Clostridium disporicum]|uniref:GDSL-type esterase/lipase family protein n=1 Tax=Clostridium disporicum TaxID=84024 RepID=UPI00155DA81E|nr:GDSL-type esterase/lipase family protein [Clostridium disporicum]
MAGDIMVQLIKGVVDTQKNSYRSIGQVSAGDDLELELEVKMNGQPIEFINPECELLIKKSDNNKVRQTKDIIYQDGKFKIKVDEQGVTYPGIVSNQLVINDEGRVSTCLFYFNVGASLEREVLQSISKVETLEQLDEYVVTAFSNLDEYETRLTELDGTMKTTNEEITVNESERKVNESERKTNETLRIENEKERVKKENERSEAEIDRKESELDRIKNENARRIAENTRIARENARENAEVNRNAIFEENEVIRNEAEKLREKAEAKRKENFSNLESLNEKLNEAEAERVRAEGNRESKETERQLAESEREKAEANRENTYTNFNDAEVDRRNNENARIQAENLRVQAESIRSERFETAQSTRETKFEESQNTRDELFKASETARATEEIAREKAESIREGNEAIRVNSESLRESAENARQQEEIKRSQAEVLRVEAEKERELSYEEIKKDNSTFKDNINSQYEDIVTEFDKVIANVTNGNENATNSEIVQARGKEVNLNARLDNFDEQLDKIINLKLLMDVDSTSYKINDIISVDKITRLQNLYMAQFLRNLRKGSPVTIACMGDSMTYGHDTTSSDKRNADTTPCDDGSKHSFTRASITYPEALQKYLNKIYSNNVTVINRGYSGDYVKKGIDRWNKKHGANLTIIMYATNDSRADYVPEQYRGNIEEFLKWYEQAIIREILWGKAVVVFAPPKLQSFGDLDVDTFANGLIQLCKKYNVPYIDSELFTINYNSINSDGVHFNGIGYEIFGMKSASVFVAENLLKPQYVKGGTKLLNRQTIDSFVVNGTYSYNATSGAYTPSELNNTGGSVLNLNPGSSITYSFYCEEDDMFVIPYIYTISDKIKISLDYGLKAPENSLDASIGKGATPLDKNKSVIEIINKDVILIDKDKVFTNDVECLRIPTKGWHTLTISNEHRQSTDGTLVINGIEFMNYDVYASYVNINKFYNQNYLKYTSHSILSSEDSVTEMRIKPSDYLKLHPFYYLANTEYWRNPPLELVITDYLKGSVIYTFTIGNNAETTMFHGEREKLGSYSGGRTVSNITLDNDTREIVITFNGGLTNKSNLLLKLV